MSEAPKPDTTASRRDDVRTLLKTLREGWTKLSEDDRLESVKDVLLTLALLDPLDTDVFLEQLKTITGFSKTKLEDQLHVIQLSEGKQAVQATSPLNEEGRQEAETLLRDPQLIQRFLDALEQLGCVGETVNKKLVGLTFTSRLLDSPINLTVQGESAGGKSYLVEQVARLFPRSEVHLRSRLTSQALFYVPKDSLKHKVLVVFERSGSEQSDYAVRTLQSEGKLIISYPARNPQTGKQETVDHEIEGPVAYVETTIKAHLDPQNESRCFMLSVDEGEEQTKAIFAAQNREVSEQFLACGAERQRVIHLWQTSQLLLKPYPVIIPFAEHITFPTKPLRVRRDRKRFLALIEASTVWHQYQRKRVIVGERECLVAEIADYAVAYELAQAFLGQLAKGISPNGEKLVIAAWELVRERAEFGDPTTIEFTRSEIEKRTQRSRPTVMRYVEEAIKRGFLERTKGGDGVEHRFRVVREVSDVVADLLRPEALENAWRTGAQAEQANLSTCKTPAQDAVDNITAGAG